MASAPAGQEPAGHPPPVWRGPVRRGLHASAAARKPRLQQGNGAKRLDCAWKHWSRRAEEQQPVLWTESQCETFGSDEECLQASVERAGGSSVTSTDGASSETSAPRTDAGLKAKGGHPLNFISFRFCCVLITDENNQLTLPFLVECFFHT